MRIDTKSKWLSIRLALVYFTLLSFLFIVILRLVQLQLLKNPELSALAEKQFQKVDKKSAYRLPIWDRNQVELAVSIPSNSVFARPKLIPRKKHVAKQLSEVLGGNASDWLKKIEGNKGFVWLKRQVSDEAVKKLDELDLPGIFVEPENKRSYPNGKLAAALLGFTDIDGNGLSGLEFSLDEELLEQSSSQRILRDGKGNPTYMIPMDRAKAAKKGVQLTLDRRLQHLVENELEKAHSQLGAKSIFAVAMDPYSGEIYAMAQTPSFDPNRFQVFDPNNYQNFSTSHLYEPGSTFKVLFAAEAIEQKILEPESLIDCEWGKYKIGNKKIGEAETSHRYGVIPLRKVIANSSNIGAVKVVQQLGKDRVQGVLQKLSFSKKLDMGFPAEATTAVKGEAFWQPFNLASVGFGQGISVTPMHLLAGYSAFANGGFWVKPKILMRQVTKPHQLASDAIRVYSRRTTEKIREMLTAVTEEGTGMGAQIPNIRVAGKTGTAQKYDSKMGYEGKKYLASFIGILPADNPEILVGVWVDEPKGKYYASDTAVPLFKKIAQASIYLLGRNLKENSLPEQLPAQQNTVSVPKEIEDDPDKMPDLNGLSVREALHRLQGFQNPVKIVGAGFLTRQHPEAGSEVKSKGFSLYFEPPKE